MSTSKTALLSILVACWLAGLLSQLPAWDLTLRYLIISLLIAAVAVARRQYQTAYARARKPRNR
jgi:hypothetical protein